MENTIFIKKYTEDHIAPINSNEVWRYAGYSGKTDEISDELNDCFENVKSDLSEKFSYKVCYRRMKSASDGGKSALSFPLRSKSLKALLTDCDEIIIFASTIGLELDRYVSRMQKISPLKALLGNALGSERIEALCDKFCEDIKHQVSAEGLFPTKRFSPGYGDLPLTAQNELFMFLDCSRQIGISLNESLLMSPSKSVTAIVGLKKTKCDITHKCDECGKKDCQFRKQENDENNRVH